MDQNRDNERTFALLSEEARIVRSARMLSETDRLQPNQRTDITERCQRFLEEHGLTQASVGREIGVSSTTISEILRLCYKGKTADGYLVKIHNWLELAARRQSTVWNQEFVDHAVAAEILQVAGIVAETCKMGLVFGPAHIGKTFTLTAIEGDACYGDPVLITVDDSTMRPFSLCRRTCRRFDLSTSGTFDTVFDRLVKRLAGTKRMLMFDEADLACYRALEMVRQLHDQTGCPILFAGKPAIYEHLGFRTIGPFSEKLDQMGARIVIHRDLTERTRGDNPQPLYTIEDIRKLIKQAQLKIAVSPDAAKWLQGRACTLGMGGIGKTLIYLYLAFKLAYVTGAAEITAEHLEDVGDLTMGCEDAKRLADVVAESSGMHRVV